ncbi:MAG: hypothetical protein ABL895_21210 [Cyclobacteriaceae bacterium]
MIKGILLILVLLVSGMVKGQNPLTETIQWNASGFKDLGTNQDFVNNCQLITYGKSRVKWIQDNSKSILQLNVTSTIGTWPNINNEGSIKYKFSDGTLSGELIITKSGSQWVAELTILGGTDTIRLRYSISSIKKI